MINWTTITNRLDYENLRYAFLLKTEEQGTPKLLPYNDGAAPLDIRGQQMINWTALNRTDYKSRSSRSLCSLAFAFMILLFMTSACAQNPATSATSSLDTKSLDTKTVLQPYLGKWRPTSFSKELHMVSITITETGLSIEAGGSVTYEFVKKTDEGVIVRVIDRHATNPHLGLTHSHTTAFGFSLEMQTLDSFPPGGPSKTRELLLICHGSGDIDSAVKRLISEMKTRRCPDVYIR